MLQALLPVLAPMLGDVLRRVLPDPEQAARVQAELTMEMVRNSHALEAAAADIIKAEAASEHWLAANWRPLLMLTFGGLIVARWFGWAAPELSEAEYIKLWDIVQLGIGGYTIGRSVEKVVPSITDAIRRKP
jgi:hypothetical protein